MFSMCSELAPRAHVPDNRIPQLMQPWFLDAYKDGANALDVVARTRELKKRHRVPLVMPDDQSKRAYARKRQTRSCGEEEEIEQEAIVQEEQDEEGVLARLLLLNDCLNAQGAKDEDLTACILELSSVVVAALLYLCLFVFFNLPTLR